jgi:hypothetical protein
MKVKFLPGPVILGVFLLVSSIGFSGVAPAQDARVIWNGAERAAFDPAKTANVTNLTINLDRLHVTLVSGTIQFSQPVNGRVFAAAFQGQGKLEIVAPDAREAQQLKLFSNQDTLNLTFTEAAFNFSGAVFDQLSGKFTWNTSAAGNLENIYQDQMKQQDENGSPDTPRIVESLLSTEGLKEVFFQAYVKTNDHGWMKASYDARDIEDIRLGRWIGGYVGSFDTWAHFPAGVRSAGEAFRDPLSKVAYAVDGYEIQVQLASDTEMAASCAVKLQPRRKGDRLLLFGLNSNLRVDSVKDETGAALTYFQDRDPKDHYPHYGDFVAVELPAPLSPGQHTLTFHYAGKRVVRNVGRGNYFVPSYQWYPANSVDFATRVNFDLTFTYPKKFLLVATGDKASETDDGKETTSIWKNAKPLAVAGFAFGDYKVSTQKVGAIQVDAYVNRNQDDTLGSISQYLNSSLPSASSMENLTGVGTGGAAMQTTAVGNLNPADLTKAVNTEMANTLKIFQEYYGTFPYDRVAVTNIPYSYGQGWPMLLFLSSFSFLDSQQQHTLGFKDQVGLTDFFRAHEMSHQWWGHRVGWKSYHDQWMSEGFAQFSGNLYVQFRESMGQYLGRIRLDKQELLSKNRFGHVNESLGPIWMGQRLSSSFAPDGYNVVIYDKGGLILHSLRMLMWDAQNPDPDHNFKDMMKDFCQTYDNQAASTEDFKTVVEKHMLPNMDLDGNHRMDWFFNQYVYGTGVPQYKLNYTVQPMGDKWLVSGEMLQSGVPDGWKDTVRVYIQLKGKPQPIPTGWLRTAAKSSTFKFVLPVKPDKVALNSLEDTLAVIQ